MKMLVAVGAREQALPLQVRGGCVGGHERLDAPEVVPLGVDAVPELLDAGRTRLALTAPIAGASSGVYGVPSCGGVPNSSW
jgi:hypothetical protein